jgi:diadenosine tetraphosphate (Ap4A) HIT family hydrolase
MAMLCIFCNLPLQRVWFEEKNVLVFRDAYPISNGHSLIIPKRHVQSIFELNEDEIRDVFLALKKAKNEIHSNLKPDGFNVGINDGVAAGQTVMHLHIHLIPRFLGDIDDPRGGVRWIFPDKAKYWQ